MRPVEEEASTREYRLSACQEPGIWCVLAVLWTTWDVLAAVIVASCVFFGWALWPRKTARKHRRREKCTVNRRDEAQASAQRRDEAKDDDGEDPTPLPEPARAVPAHRLGKSSTSASKASAAAASTPGRQKQSPTSASKASATAASTADRRRSLTSASKASASADRRRQKQSPASARKTSSTATSTVKLSSGSLFWGHIVERRRREEALELSKQPNTND